MPTPRHLRPLALLVAALLSTQIAPAAEASVASIDLNKVFTSYARTKAAEADQNKEREAAKAEIAAIKDPAQHDARRKELENQLQRRFLERRNEIIADITTAVRQVQREKGIAFIFDVSGQSASKVPLVFASESAPDVTADVQAALPKTW